MNRISSRSTSMWLSSTMRSSIIIEPCSCVQVLSGNVVSWSPMRSTCTMRRAQTNNATDNECIERMAERPVAEIVAQPGHLDEQFLPRTEPEVRLQSVDVVEQEAGEVRRPNRMLETPMRRARKHVIRRAHLRQVTKPLELQRIDHVDQLGIDINQA